ncbi:VanZ family protein [Peptoniphilus asaccharolyticus]
MKKKIVDIILFVTLIIYFLSMIIFLFKGFRYHENYNSYNLIPFKSILNYLYINNGSSFENLIGNIILFIPLGIYLPIYLKSNNKFNLFIMFVISIIVEFIQWFFNIGIFDIDDIILNIIGGIIGIGIFELLKINDLRNLWYNNIIRRAINVLLGSSLPTL